MWGSFSLGHSHGGLGWLCGSGQMSKCVPVLCSVPIVGWVPKKGDPLVPLPVLGKGMVVLSAPGVGIPVALG